jgi:energy-coupling factor transporter ATP-binding protein EcfA2
MRIISFEFDAGLGGWRLEKMSFNTDLTLLVGASGVGKTLILRSLTDLPKVAKGVSYPEMSWRFEFESDEGHYYCWEGKIASDVSVLSGKVKEMKEGECGFQQEKLTLEPSINKPNN